MISNLLRCTVCGSTGLMVSLRVSHTRPLLEYGSCVWNVSTYLRDTQRLESFQRRWTRESHGISWMEHLDKLRNTGLYCINVRLIWLNLVMVWKTFHSEEDLGFDSVSNVVRDVAVE